MQVTLSRPLMPCAAAWLSNGRHTSTPLSNRPLSPPLHGRGDGSHAGASRSRALFRDHGAESRIGGRLSDTELALGVDAPGGWSRRGARPLSPEDPGSSGGGAPGVSATLHDTGVQALGPPSTLGPRAPHRLSVVEPRQPSPQPSPGRARLLARAREQYHSGGVGGVGGVGGSGGSAAATTIGGGGGGDGGGDGVGGGGGAAAGRPSRYSDGRREGREGREGVEERGRGRAQGDRDVLAWTGTAFSPPGLAGDDGRGRRTRERERGQEREGERQHHREGEREREWEWEQQREQVRDRERLLVRERRDRDRDQEREREQVLERDQGWDVDVSRHRSAPRGGPAAPPAPPLSVAPVAAPSRPASSASPARSGASSSPQGGASSRMSPPPGLDAHGAWEGWRTRGGLDRVEGRQDRDGFVVGRRHPGRAEAGPWDHRALGPRAGAGGWGGDSAREGSGVCMSVCMCMCVCACACA